MWRLSCGGFTENFFGKFRKANFLKPFIMFFAVLSSALGLLISLVIMIKAYGLADLLGQATGMNRCNCLLFLSRYLDLTLALCSIHFETEELTLAAFAIYWKTRIPCYVFPVLCMYVSALLWPHLLLHDDGTTLGPVEKGQLLVLHFSPTSLTTYLPS